MQKTILRYGLIGGSIVSVLMIGTIFMMRNSMDDMGAGSMVYGFGTMILAFSSIFFAIRSYCNENGGNISFGKSLLIGLGISVIASAMYTGTWLIYVSTAGKGFEAKYAAAQDARLTADSTTVINKMIAENKSAGEIESTQKAYSEKRAGNAQMMDMYQNNILIKAGVTATEILPVGLIMSLLMALIFQFMKKPETPQAG